MIACPLNSECHRPAVRARQAGKLTFPVKLLLLAGGALVVGVTGTAAALAVGPAGAGVLPAAALWLLAPQAATMNTHRVATTRAALLIHLVTANSWCKHSAHARFVVGSLAGPACRKGRATIFSIRRGARCTWGGQDRLAANGSARRRHVRHFITKRN